MRLAATTRLTRVGRGNRISAVTTSSMTQPITMRAQSTMPSWLAVMVRVEAVMVMATIATAGNADCPELADW